MVDVVDKPAPNPAPKPTPGNAEIGKAPPIPPMVVSPLIEKLSPAAGPKPPSSSAYPPVLTPLTNGPSVVLRPKLPPIPADTPALTILFA